MQPDEREIDSEIAKRGLEFLEWLSLRPETEIAVVRPKPAECIAVLSSTNWAPSHCGICWFSLGCLRSYA